MMAIECLDLCGKLKREKYLNAKLKRVINKRSENNLFEGVVAYSVEHKKGYYKYHYILEENGKIIDPFLLEEGLIAKEDYLQKYYKNYQDLKII